VGKGVPDWASLVALAAHLGRSLQAQEARIVTAESCTGGLIAALLTETAGSSAWFDRGFVTYSNASKVAQLGVHEDSLTRHGAVSETVVREMAQGALKASCAQVAIAVSGVAGPTGGSAEKPVGTVCLAWAFDPSGGEGDRAAASVFAVSARFPGDRHAVRMFSARLALRMAEQQWVATRASAPHGVSATRI
jgi:nicotinamide-nucleotide amidase